MSYDTALCVAFFAPLFLTLLALGFAVRKLVKVCRKLNYVQCMASECHDAKHPGIGTLGQVWEVPRLDLEAPG